MNIPAWMLVHTISVETQTGEGAQGDTYAAAVTRKVFVDEQRQLVRGTSGAEVVSEATVFDVLSAEGIYAPASRVTLPSGRVTSVLTAKRRDDGGLGAPSHVEVTLA